MGSGECCDPKWQTRKQTANDTIGDGSDDTIDSAFDTRTHMKQRTKWQTHKHKYAQRAVSSRPVASGDGGMCGVTLIAIVVRYAILLKQSTQVFANGLCVWPFGRIPCRAASDDRCHARVCSGQLRVDRQHSAFGGVNA